MKTNLLKEGTLTEHSAGLGTVTRKMVRERAAELDAKPKAAVLESAPESERWDPVPGSRGHKVPVAASDDEDDEGRSDGERLVEEGIAGAEHDQMRRASSEAKTDL